MVNTSFFFLLSIYSNKLYGKIGYRTQIGMRNFIQAQASRVFGAILGFDYQNFLGSPYMTS